MNFLKIKTNSGYYNFYSNDNFYYVTHTNTKRTTTLSEIEIKDLLEYIFSSAMKYSHDENGYNIYIDEMDNKRYFKDGKENLIMFIYNNGISSKEFKNNIISNENINKIITLKIKKDIITMALIVTETAALFSGSLALNKYYQEASTYLPIDSHTALQLIDESPTLTDEQKEFFKNSDFIEDILLFASHSRSNELKQRLNNFGIIYFNLLDKINPKNKFAVGYYDSVFSSNKIHLKDESFFDDVAAHEFVHLFQCYTQYDYLKEPCAEIMSHEYFNDDDGWTYLNEVNNLCLLMEVIGPKPIIECCFAGNDAPLEESIGKYLTESDKKSFLKELRYMVSNADDTIIKMYIHKMIAKKAKEHPELKYLSPDLFGSERISCYNRRSYYFNQHAKEFYNSTTASLISNTVEEVDKKDIVELIYPEIEIVDGNKITELYENNRMFDYQEVTVFYKDKKGNKTRWDLVSKGEFRPRFSPENEEEFHDFKEFYDYIKSDPSVYIQLTKNITITDKSEISKKVDSIEYSGIVMRDTTGTESYLYKMNNKLIRRCTEEITPIMPSIRDLFPEQCFVETKHNNDIDQMLEDENGNVSTSTTVTSKSK